MRPAQLTPENSAPPDARWSTADRFNEAGAINAGKHEDWINLSRIAYASMRPAQLTPENDRGDQARDPKRFGFNEAGAINAGKRGQVPVRNSELLTLQ